MYFDFLYVCRVLGYTTKVCPRAGKLRGHIGVGCENCGGIWAKNGRKLAVSPRTFILGRIFPRTFRALGVAFPQFSAYRLLVPCVGASRPRIFPDRLSYYLEFLANVYSERIEIESKMYLGRAGRSFKN